MLRKNLLLLGAVALFALLSVYVTRNHSIGSAEGQPGAFERADREPALAFALPDPDGRTVALSDYVGRAVIVNFWATWCKWCTREMPHLQRAYEEHRDDGLVVLAVNVGEQADEAVAYMKEYGYSFDVVLDEDKSVTRAHGIRSIPVSLWVDKEGYVVRKKLGYMTEEEIREGVSELLAG